MKYDRIEVLGGFDGVLGMELVEGCGGLVLRKSALGVFLKKFSILPVFLRGLDCG